MKQIAACIIAFSCLGFHLLCTILYNAPINPVTGNYRSFVNKYMEPYFIQKWLLFAPEPATSSLKLWYRVRVQNKWMYWVDPLAPVLARHQQNRFTCNAKLLYVYGNIAKDLSFRYETFMEQFPCADSNHACPLQREDSLTKTIEYKQALRYALSDLQAENRASVHPDSLQLMVIQIYPKQFSERLSKKPFGLANSTEFKAVALK